MQGLEATELVTYRCPECRTYNEPFMHNKKGIAFMVCKNCNAQYKTSVPVSRNFRLFSQKLGSQKNKSQGYYTSGEKKIKDELIELGYKEGIDFIHNCRVKNDKVYYWIDFYLPLLQLALEYSPEVWHRMDGRKETEDNKREFLESNGILVITISSDEDLDSIRERLG